MKAEFFPKMTHSLKKLKMNTRSRSTIYFSRMFVIFPVGWFSENIYPDGRISDDPNGKLLVENGTTLGEGNFIMPQESISEEVSKIGFARIN